ncbi:hypothetical protein [Nocardia salmonicida]|uniref:hypothetical protein n=1 Tax=Nocardia salmonicida TaxID=53431 RepID=UPI003CF7B370
MSDDTDLGPETAQMAWFFALDPDEQVQLIADPQMALPPSMINRITALGGSASTTYWDGQPPGPLRLTPHNARLLNRRRQQLLEWWSRLPADVQQGFLDNRHGEMPEELRGFALEAVTTPTEPSSTFSVGPFSSVFLEWRATTGEPA